LLAQELGIRGGSSDRMESYESLAGCQAYTNYPTRLAVYGSDEEILAAMLVDLPVWGANCSKIISFLKKNHGFANSSCIFLDQFATPLLEDFIEKSNILMIGRNIPQKVNAMQRAARLILDYELLFWNTIYNYSA